MAHLLACDICKIIKPMSEFKIVGDKDICNYCFEPVQNWLDGKAFIVNEEDYKFLQEIRGKQKYGT